MPVTFLQFNDVCSTTPIDGIGGIGGLSRRRREATAGRRIVGALEKHVAAKRVIAPQIERRITVR
jgi:hypothetical protein